MSVWSFYHRETGELSRKIVTGPDGWQPNPPQGHHAVEGEYDALSQRVNVKTGEVVNWQPPQPSEDHEWDDQSKRWRLNAASRGREERHRNASVRIQQLESSQHRALREAALGDPEAIQRLKNIDDEIAALRGDLKGG